MTFSLKKPGLDNKGVYLNFSARKPGLDGQGGPESWDGLTPLHLSCGSGQDQIVQCLIEHNADINAQVYCMSHFVNISKTIFLKLSPDFHAGFEYFIS